MPISVGRTAAAIIGALAAFLIVDRLLTGNLSDWNYIRLYNYDVSTVPGNSAHAHDPQPAAPPAFDLETKPLKRPSAVFSEKDVDDVQLKASSYTCDDEELLYRVCIFHDMVYHQGWLLYLLEDEKAASKTKFPNLTLWEVGNGPNWAFTIHERVRKVSLAEMQSRLAAEARDAQKPGTIRVAEFEKSILHKTRTMTHIFWGMNGAGNIFLRLCKYLNACTWEEIQGAAIMGPNGNRQPAFRSGLGSHIKAVGDLMACFGPTFWINPPGADDKTNPDNRIVILRNMVAGVGDEVGEPLSAKGPDEEIRFKRPRPALALARQRHFRQCAGLPRDPPPATGASVLLVNRPHGDGRHILGLDDVYDRLMRSLPSDIPVRLFYPRSEGLADQAAAFSSANVLVVPHGAANANFAFLPHKATIFALYAVKSRHNLDQDHAMALPSPPYNITFVSVNCSDAVQVNTAKLAALPQFAELSPKEKASLLEGSTVSGDRLSMIKKAIKLSSREYMKYADYSIDPDALAQQVAVAALALHEEVRAQR